MSSLKSNPKPDMLAIDVENNLNFYNTMHHVVKTLRAECTNVDNRRIKLIYGLSEDLLEFGMHQAQLSSTGD